MQSEILLSLSSVQKRFGEKSVLDGIGIEIRRAEILLVVGVNGVGKSTLLDILADVLIPDSFHRKDTNISRSEIGYMTSSDEFFEPLKAHSFMRFFSDYYGVPSVKANQKIKELLEYFNLSYVLDQDFKNLSSGEKKRIKIIASILHQPKVLLLDEPFENCDYKQCFLISEMISQLRNSGMAVVVVAHNLEFVEEVYDRLLILADSKTQHSYSKIEIERQGLTLKQTVRGHIL